MLVFGGGLGGWNACVVRILRFGVRRCVGIITHYAVFGCFAVKFAIGGGFWGVWCV